MPLHSDKDLAAAFLKSTAWKRHRQFLPYKHKNGTRDLVRTFIRTYENIPHNADTPEEIELATGRVTKLIHSDRGRQAATTRKENLHARITYRAERAHKKYLAEKRARLDREYAASSPSLFGEGLPVQKKPSRNVA